MRAFAEEKYCLMYFMHLQIKSGHIGCPRVEVEQKMRARNQVKQRQQTFNHSAKKYMLRPKFLDSNMFVMCF